MKRTVLPLILILTLLTISCTPIKRPLDNRVGFSRYLAATENCILEEDWNNAMKNLKSATRAWKQIKPLFQLDIDHDYVNDMENNLALLKGYILAESKADAAAVISLLQETWESIGEM